MSFASPPASQVAAPALPARRSRLSLLLDLTKARLSALVVFTTGVAFVVASRFGVDWVTLLWTVTGTALAAGGASALNQVIEAHRDRLMERTRHRPVPSGAMAPAAAFIAAVLMCQAGVTMLAAMVNWAAAGLALLTIVIYVLLYTPLKVRTSLNTVVGAVVGAIPPMIGWVGARGTIDTGAWALAAILFIWQIPHFLALAWRLREQYAGAGFVMLPVVDHSGRLTSQVVVLSSLALVPVALAASLTGLAGIVYAGGAVVLGLGMSFLATRLYLQRTDANSRRVFLASLVYLPLMLCLMMIDRGPLAGGVTSVPITVATESMVVGLVPD